MGTILAQVPSTPNYVLGSRASHPAMVSEHFDEEIEEEEPVVDTPVCQECGSQLPLDRGDFLCSKCRAEQTERTANRDRADRDVEQARRQQQATRSAQACIDRDVEQARRRAVVGAAVGTNVTLLRGYVNPSSGVKYEAGTAGVLGEGGRGDMRLVEFSKCPWWGSFLVPCGMLELAKDTPATELAEEPTPTWGHPFGAGKAGRGLSV
jgi:hypothetical protein